MAEITLRAYVKEIDDLIEREKLDEAIAHCRHILQIYPKHLETYRLLGKAYLEAKRFGDAADIFQRVLSAVPDDFVSHVGMALVREDEGNLDAAIWHMERAFETNPANPAIRQELSRLIGRRDGLEPHKVRLTRGALARQYAKGELFPQAISELRSALQEDPDRPDLEVLLAKMYWRGGQLNEAKKVCDQILEKLPFSLEASRIMADLSEKKGDEQKAGEFHRKIAALDPYYGFLESVELNPATVDAGAVRIEQSTWSPGEPLPTVEEGPPAWVTSLGVDLSEGESDAVSASPQPAWLSDLDASGSERPKSPSIIEPAFAGGDINSELESEDAIPEWMREAGWGPATGEADEAAGVSFSDDELDALDSGMEPMTPQNENEGELAPADIPSWMRSIAPKDEEQGEVESTQPKSQPEEGMDQGLVPDWLSEVASESEADAGEQEPPVEEEAAEVDAPLEEEPQTEPEEEAGPGVPTWIDTQSPGATSTIIAWLGDREADASDEEQAVEDLAAAFGAGGEGQLENFPSWLEDEESAGGADEAVAEESGAAEGPPSWLAGVAQAASSQSVSPGTEEHEEPPEEEPPSYSGVDTGADTEDWVRTLAEQEEAASDVAPTPGGSDWLTGLGEEGETEEESAEVPPEWLAADSAEEDEMIASRLSSAAQTPDWLEGVEEVSPEIPPEGGDVPDWLMGIAEGASPRPPAEPAGFEAEAEGEAPDWLSGVAAEEAEPTSAAEPEFDPQALQEFEAEISLEPSEEETAGGLEQAAITDNMDDEDVFKWLESLAEGQDAAGEVTSDRAVRQIPDEVPSTPEPGLREEAPPDEPDESLRWLEDLASQRGIDIDIEASTFQAAIQPAAPETPPPSPPTAPPEESPPPPQAEVEQAPPHSGEDSPDWLIEMATLDTEETIVTSRPPMMPEEPTAQEPDAAAEHEAAAGSAEPVEDEVPGWLDEAAAVAQEVPAEPSRAIEQPPETPVEETTAPPVTPAPAVQEPTPAQPASGMTEPEPTEPPAPPPVQPPAAETAAPAEAAFTEQAPPEAKKEEPTEAPPQPAPAVTAATPEPEPEPAAEEAKPVEPSYKEPPTDAQLLLKSARGALAAGDAGRALSDYRKLIERKQNLDTVINDLESALDRYPNLPTLWQALGDAFMKADRLNDAIKAYQRGMEVA
jgi:tetratricopeptide (TPR) repeat protein